MPCGQYIAIFSFFSLFFFEIVCQAQVGVTKPRQQTAPGSSKETAPAGKKTVLQHRLS